MAINVVLAVVSALCVAYIVRQLLAPMPMPTGRPRPASPAATASAEPARLPHGVYTVVAARNLFSPTRSEAPPTPTASTPAMPTVKPSLFGVVVRDGGSIAYLEDPTTKRVAGYRIGDAIAGGRLQSITADSVVINRPDGRMDVRLHDPTRPRAAATGPGAAPGQLGPGQQPGLPLGVPGGMQPGIPGGVPPLGVPGGVPPGVPGGLPPGVTLPQPIAPGLPGATAPPATPNGQREPAVSFPGRRPLPPNLLRRGVPAAPSTDAPQR